MKYSILLLLISIVLVTIGCQRKSAPLIDNETVISISTVCGWCTGGDSLVINANQSVYRYYASCDQTKAVEKTVETDKVLWNDLVSLLDREAFARINLNVCNVCADGCDVRVTLKDKNYNHSISYGGSTNEAVAAIRPFLEKLETIRAGYKKEHKK